MRRLFSKSDTFAPVLIVCLWVQGDGHEGSNPGQWPPEGPADLPEDVLLHHAGRHAAAAFDHQGGHDGESTSASFFPLFVVVVQRLSAGCPPDCCFLFSFRSRPI